MIAPVPVANGQLWRGLAGLAACALICLAAFATGATAAPSTPQTSGLHVGTGSVTVTSGKLKGSATIRNGSGPIGRRVYVTLIVQLTGPDRLLKRTPVDRLGEGAAKTIGYSLKLPTTLPIGRHKIWVCVGHSPAVPEPSVLVGCREVGGVNVPVPRLSPPSAPPASTEAPKSTPAAPVNTVPTAPIAYEAGQPQVVNDAGEGYYWLNVPASYDRSNQTPTTLFVWLHGCGGESSGDIYTVSPETVGTPARPRDWISIAVGGTDDGCWTPSADEGLVKNAIADVETHFNIDRHRVILGGYSSGGDLAYRLAFYGGVQFAGVLAENTSPFRDTESTEAASLAAAGWKFPVVHLAHLQDDEYPIAGVRQETEAMVAAGFPLTRIEVDGGHYDEPGEIENGHAVPGTDADLVTYLLPHIDDGWRSP
jgi:pimeloyl-ACP methyl ester carboxylesterase